MEKKNKYHEKGTVTVKHKFISIEIAKETKRRNNLLFALEETQT